MWFEQLISPLDPVTFLNSTRGVDWLRSTGPRDRFERLFPLDEFERWLNETRWDEERLYLIKNDKRYDRAKYLYDPDFPRHCRPIGTVVQRYMQEGATLVANAIDEAIHETAALAEEMERIFNVYVGINAYSTRGDQQAFETHWDRHDVFIIQIRGRKKWTVWRPTALHPVDEIAPLVPKPKEEVWTGELCAGDVLYLPRGWWHRVQGVGEESLHLSVGVIEPIGRDFLKWLKDRSVRSSVFRQSLPRLEDPDKIEEWLEKSREKVLSMWNREHLQAFMDELALKAVARPRIAGLLNGNGRKAFDNEASVRLARTRWVTIKPTDNGTVDVGVGPTTIRTTSAVAGILGQLRNTSATPVAELLNDAVAHGCEKDLRTALETLRMTDQLEVLH